MRYVRIVGTRSELFIKSGYCDPSLDPNAIDFLKPSVGPDAGAQVLKDFNRTPYLRLAKGKSYEDFERATSELAGNRELAAWYAQGQLTASSNATLNCIYFFNPPLAPLRIVDTDLPNAEVKPGILYLNTAPEHQVVLTVQIAAKGAQRFAIKKTHDFVQTLLASRQSDDDKETFVYDLQQHLFTEGYYVSLSRF